MPAAFPLIAKPPAHPGVTAPPPKTLVVWSPEGVREEHPTANARDLVRSRGYTLHAPVADEAFTPKNAEYASPAIAGKEENVPNPAMDALIALRKKAEALGITVDNRWGTRRLNELIAEAEANPKASE